MADVCTGARIGVRGAGKTFRPEGGAPVEAVAPLDLDVSPGEFVAIVGPSGCGKSTLLRMIAGLEAPEQGRVDVDAGARVSFVFQEAHLLPWRTVAQNVALPLEIAGAPPGERDDKVAHALGQVELSDAADRYPAELSGGMRMRASIARALVVGPRLLLMDEPFAALDELSRNRLDERLRELWRRERFTALFVTHSIHEAAFLSQRVVVMSRRPSRVVLDAPIDLPDERATSLRGEATFARVSARLLAALEQGAS